MAMNSSNAACSKAKPRKLRDFVNSRLFFSHISGLAQDLPYGLRRKMRVSGSRNVGILPRYVAAAQQRRGTEPE